MRQRYADLGCGCEIELDVWEAGVGWMREWDLGGGAGEWYTGTTCRAATACLGCYESRRGGGEEGVELGGVWEGALGEVFGAAAFGLKFS